MSISLFKVLFFIISIGWAVAALHDASCIPPFDMGWRSNADFLIEIRRNCGSVFHPPRHFADRVDKTGKLQRRIGRKFIAVVFTFAELIFILRPFFGHLIHCCFRFCTVYTSFLNNKPYCVIIIMKFWRGRRRKKVAGLLKCKWLKLNGRIHSCK